MTRKPQKNDQHTNVPPSLAKDSEADTGDTST